MRSVFASATYANLTSTIAALVAVVAVVLPYLHEPRFETTFEDLDMSSRVSGESLSLVIPSNVQGAPQDYSLRVIYRPVDADTTALTETTVPLYSPKRRATPEEKLFIFDGVKSNICRAIAENAACDGVTVYQVDFIVKFSLGELRQSLDTKELIS